MSKEEDDIVYENDVYQVVIGYEDDDTRYWLLNKETDVVEYKDHMLPQIISVAIHAAEKLNEVLGKDKDQDEESRVLRLQ